ncbi:DUF1273 domain-containing protein [Bacillus sp. 1NLA3E]|uniref:DUF1273 domain-containing protein n=1 Tax=Bacillus sp. 1NLA3E TaxID=666686 RepID=UPI000247F4B9|nr:DUF1273 domain-containing protein [Bacillus sp. 1NLA3E]AGK54656.1 hypothetical protein B1NLA3E_14550 [Bacillus sp. 1NLA3E]
MVKVVAVSGYKPFELGIFQANHPAVGFIKKAIRKELEQLLEEGLEWVIISGQLGTELWAAEVVFDLQNDFPSLQLGVFTPFLKQEESWKAQNKESYESVLIQADYVDSISKKPYEGAWQFRQKNQFFVKKSDALLLFYDQEKDGSPKFLYEYSKQYKESHPYDLRLIGFDDLQILVEEEQGEQY